MHDLHSGKGQIDIRSRCSFYLWIDTNGLDGEQLVVHTISFFFLVHSGFGHATILFMSFVLNPHLKFLFWFGY